MIHETNKYALDFRQCERIKSFGESILNGKITLGDPYEKQSNLLNKIVKLKSVTRPKNIKNLLQKVLIYFLNVEN